MQPCSGLWDLVTIKGGGVYNALSINTLEISNFKVLKDQGRVLFQKGAGGSTISVANLQRITVLDENGKTIYTYNAGIVPSSIALLLLLED
jgi:hypothetical protein